MTRPYFSGERLGGVLVVFKLDHRVILLGPINAIHKANFT
jgi:hypothetical protein